MKSFEVHRKKPHLYVVFDGLEDPELITLKGRKALEWAKVIFYDNTVKKGLLSIAGPECRFINIDSMMGYERLIVFYTYRYNQAVWLTSDDPEVMQRIPYVIERGVTVTSVPGIPAALSVPVSIGIPPTRRGANESVWIMEHSELTDAAYRNLRCAARSSAALIIKIKMMHSIGKVAQVIKTVRGEHEPMVIVKEGNRINGTAGIFSSLSYREDGTKTILVIGKIASAHMNFGAYPSAMDIAI